MKLMPFTELRTERLILRKIEETDHEVILFLRSDKAVNKFIERPADRQTKNKEDAIKFIKEINEGIEKNKFISWGITLKNDAKIIGTICLWNFTDNNKTAEVGFDLNPKFQGKGIMSEALHSIIHFGFKELDLHRIEAFTHHKNESSIKLLGKNGFMIRENRKDLQNNSNVILELENPIYEAYLQNEQKYTSKNRP